MTFSGNDADAPEQNTLRLRLGGRVLLFDAEGRLLLMEDSDPSDPARGTWWMTPGGGIEPGENAAEAARRELLEETGLGVAAVHGPVGTSEFTHAFQGPLILQRDSYFHARAPEAAARELSLTPAELASMRGSRWWTLAEIESTDATVYPENLAELVRRCHPLQRGT